MHAKPVTRFAPSPTGYLHIGGARTALFNWLYARANGGTYLLRIEDTDRARSTPDAVKAILDGLAWLGLESDAEPVYQHQNIERHKEVAHQLLEEGKAYKCFCTKEELEAMRERARALGQSPRYDGTWRDKDPSEAPEGASYVIRFKSSGEPVILKDKVQGEITISGDELDDLIIMRSDGTPTYMLSVVVDDHDMGVTHIIRGDDHLTNAARQLQLYEALGWQPPEVSHIPLIHGPDGAKLSKRHGALSVSAYRDMGFLSQAMRNYLVRLGWSHGDDEIMSLEQMIDWFGLDNVGKSPARFDMSKLENINKHYIRETKAETLLADIKALLPVFENGIEFESKLNEDVCDKMLKIMPALKERAKTLPQVIEAASFLWAELPLEIEDKLKKSLNEEAMSHLKKLSLDLDNLDVWTLENIEKAVRDYADRHDLKFGQLAQPLRAKLTGTTNSPAIFDVFFALGKKEAINRINNEEKP